MIFKALNAVQANTPIPVSCKLFSWLLLWWITNFTFLPPIDSIHLKQCVTLYLFALPLTLAHELQWATIPIVTVVAFTFMGIEGIADEIEMPFGRS